MPTSEGASTPELTPTLGPEDILPAPEGGSAGPGDTAPPSSTSDTAASSAVAGIEQLFSGSRLMEVARRTALYTLAAFAVVGAFFAVKWVLVWLWHKIRP